MYVWNQVRYRQSSVLSFVQSPLSAFLLLTWAGARAVYDLKLATDSESHYAISLISAAGDRMFILWRSVYKNATSAVLLKPMSTLDCTPGIIIISS